MSTKGGRRKERERVREAWSRTQCNDISDIHLCTDLYILHNTTQRVGLKTSPLKCTAMAFQGQLKVQL
jgi:hypothetical protein